MSKAILTSASQKLASFNPKSFNTLIGLDGFVDNIIDVVDKRSNISTYQRIETLGALGERISRAAGLSSNLELVIRQMKLGGNGPIMANAMLEAGFGVTYFGNIGKESVHPVFSEMAARCKAVYSLADPGYTDALEFRDGKLMLGKYQSTNEVTYARILEVMGQGKLKAAWEQSNLIGLTNWTMLPFQTEIWQRLLKDMQGVKAPAGAILFIDLADPEKRPAKEIADACQLLKNFRKSHRVVLGVNQKESMEVSAALGLKFNADEIEGNAAKLRSTLDLDVVVIHPTKNAACATEKGSAKLDGPFCANPKLTTGAGDNFNAGFCIGLLAGLPPEEMLAAGTANSGFYVRNGKSAKSQELSEFLKQWAARHGDAAF